MSIRKAIIAASLSLAAVAAAAEGREPVADLALVLAVDVSFSVSPGEQDVQRRGYAAAFRDPRVIEAATSGPHGRIAASYLEWAGPDLVRVVAPWTLLDGPAAARAFADALERAPVRRGGRTSLSAAIARATGLFAANPWPAARRVVDLSGDGANNAGAPVRAARDAALAQGFTINGLPLTGAAGEPGEIDIVSYYEDCVIGGPGAFLLPVAGWRGFRETLTRKLVLEIAGLAPPPRARLRLAAPTDCLAGEKAERRKYIDQLEGVTGGRPERWLPREEDWPTPQE